MKLIDEIIDLLSNTDTELENALIKAQVLAHKLGEKEIGAWIKSELVGYEDPTTVSYTHLRAHETRGNLVCRLLLEKNQRKFSVSYTHLTLPTNREV